MTFDDLRTQLACALLARDVASCTGLPDESLARQAAERAGRLTGLLAEALGREAAEAPEPVCERCKTFFPVFGKPLCELCEAAAGKAAAGT